MMFLSERNPRTSSTGLSSSNVMRLLTLAALALTAHALTRRQVDQPPVYVEGTCTIVWGDRDAKRVMRNAESFAKKGQVVTAQRLYQAILNAGDRVNDRLRIKAAKAKGDLHKQRQRKAAAEQEARVQAQIKEQLDSLPPVPTTPVDHEKIRRVNRELKEQRAKAKQEREEAERKKRENAQTEAKARKAKAAEARKARAERQRELRDPGLTYGYPDYVPGKPKKRGFAQFCKSLWRRLRGKNDDDVASDI